MIETNIRQKLKTFNVQNEMSLRVIPPEIAEVPARIGRGTLRKT